MGEGCICVSKHCVNLADIITRFLIDDNGFQGWGGACKGHQKATFVTQRLNGACKHALTLNSMGSPSPLEGAGRQNHSSFPLLTTAAPSRVTANVAIKEAAGRPSSSTTPGSETGSSSEAA